MKSVIIGLIVALSVSPVFASQRCSGGNCAVRTTKTVRVYPIPTVGKTTYTIEHPSVAKPTCKNGSCRFSK